MNSTNWDAKHKDNLFDYGYVGKFKTLQAKNYGLQEDYNYNGTVLSSAYVLQAYTDTIVQYYPNEEINPNLNAFTASYYENTGYNGIDDYDYNSAINPHSGGNTGGVWYDPDHPDNPDKYWDQIRGANDPWRDINQIRLGGGLYNGDAAPSIYGVWNTGGPVSNGYTLTEEEQFRVTLTGSADIGDHAISLDLNLKTEPTGRIQLLRHRCGFTGVYTATITLPT